MRVLEKAPGPGQKAGGVRVPPNLSKILVEWGLEEELKACGVRCKGSTFHSLETGERVGWLEWNEDVMKETGGSFLMMHVGVVCRRGSMRLTVCSMRICIGWCMSSRRARACRSISVWT